MRTAASIIPYALATFFGALLIFWLEPLYTKMLLPLFGGAPTVWIAALMFFQAVLLLGYLYSHYLARLKGPLKQAGVHLAVIALAFLFLPPAITEIDTGRTVAAPLASVLWLLVSGIGVPMIALSATAPLVQHWFSLSGHRKAGDPYFLYAASNIGSLGALVAFPLVFERVMTLPRQGTVWSGVFVFTAVLIIACGFLARAGRGHDPVSGAKAPPNPVAGLNDFGAREWAWVIALAAVPASLLSGVTLAITTDIAAVPLFWVIPLIIYLGTFILAFAGVRVLPPRLLRMAIGLFMVPVTLIVLFGPILLKAFNINISLLLFFLLGTQFLLSLACHQELRRRRPQTGHLTHYYVALAVGGLAGGAFNAVVAPLVFDSVAELPIALVLALALSRQLEETSGRPSSGLLPTLSAAVLVGGLVVGLVFFVEGAVNPLAMILAAAMAGFVLAPKPAVHGAFLALVFGVGGLTLAPQGRLFQERSFFGVVEVIEHADTGVRSLKHGTTIHGRQYTDPQKALRPLTYYGRESPVYALFKAYSGALAGKTVGVVGLGAGSLACYKTEGQKWTFYEIDPLVVEVASDPEYFTFLSACGPGMEIVVGDGRIGIEQSGETFSLVILDAFTSDSIPVHLLTREAFQAYLRHLEEGGLIMVHISNRHLNLAPLLAAIARDLDLAAMSGDSKPPVDSQEAPSRWVVLARDPARLRPLLESTAPSVRWSRLEASEGTRSWSDDYSNILAFLKW